MPNTIQRNPYSIIPLNLSTIARKSLPVLNQSNRSPEVRFGQTAADSLTYSLPEWAKSVEKPAVTLADLKETFNTADNKPSKNGSKPSLADSFKMLKEGIGKLRRLNKWNQAIRHTSRKYLPAQAKKDLRNYLWTVGLFDRLFRRNRFEIMSIVHQGPEAIKKRQTIAQRKASTLLPYLQEFVDILSNPQKRKEFTASLPASAKLVLGVLSPFIKYGLNKQIKSIKNEMSLLNNVPPVPQKEFEKELNTLKSQFNSTNPNDPIQEIGKVLNAGSIGQVFEAKTKSGKTLVLKMAKPKITKEYLEGYKPYLYFMEQLLTSAEPSQQKKAAVAAEQSVTLLKGEIDFKQEAANTQKIRETVSKLGLTGFQVPDVLAATERGMVLPYVGQKDFADMCQPEKDEVLLKMVPDLAKLMLLSPYKPLDIHAGNIRSKDGQSNGVPFLIDHGRQANLNPEAHQKLLRLLVLSEAKGLYSMFQTPEGIQAAEDALKLDERRHQKALSILAQLKELHLIHGFEDELRKYETSDKPTPKELIEKLQKKQALIYQKATQIEQHAKLVLELQPSISELFGLPPVRTKNAVGNGYDEQSKYKLPTLLNAWGNALPETNSQNGQGLSTQTIPRSDLYNYHMKMAAIMRPYFWTETNAEENKTLREKLSTLTRQDFQAAFRDPLFTTSSYALFDLEDRIDKHLFTSAFKTHSDHSAETTEKLETEFKQALQTLLQPGNKKGDLLVRAYRVNTRVQDMAKSLTDGLCQTEPTIAADPESYDQLLRSVENRLRNDLHLTADAFYKDNYLGQEKRGLLR